MTEEVWKDIVGYEGSYQVSNIGRVKSLDYHRTGEENILKLCKNTAGYLKVELWKNNKRKSFKVHRLVATAFIDNPEKKPQIDHINTIKTDNRVDNLRWCTAKENSDNPISRKRFLDNVYKVVKFGKDHFRSKAVYQYSLDNKLIRKWDCITDVQRELGISTGHIPECCSGKRKTCGGFIWKYA